MSSGHGAGRVEKEMLLLPGEQRSASQRLWQDSEVVEVTDGSGALVQRSLFSDRVREPWPRGTQVSGWSLT